MKAPYQHFVITAIFAGALALAACGKSDNNNPPPPLPPSVPVIDPYGGLQPPGIPVSFYAQNTNMNAYMPNNNTEYVINSGYTDMMKYAMGVCDRNYYNGGYSDCNKWRQGLHDIVIMMDSIQANTAKVIFRSYPTMECSSYSCSWFAYSLPSAKNFILNLFGFPTGNFSGVYNPMILDMTIWPINNDKGFEMRGYGPQGSRAWNSLIQIRAENNKLEDPNINFNVIFNQQDAAQGRLSRCNPQYSATCGLQF